MKPVKNTTILYMDDDQDDVDLLQHAFSLLDASYTLLSAPNGEEGLAMLRTLKQKNTLPCLIVLDVNMPKLCGRETFRRINEDSVLSEIPVVIFSTSDYKGDKDYFVGRSVEYMTKPVHFDQLLKAAKRLLHYCRN